MSPTKPATFRLDEDLIAALQRIKERDGIPVSEQLRRALSAWVKERGEWATAEKKAKKKKA